MEPFIPSLNALRTFEATVRWRSMSRAADELCVTHGAVSRQIKALESALGITLLLRGARSVEPTPEGLRLADGLGTAFGTIRTTLDSLKPGPLTLSCSSSITMCWLIPRVQAFNQAHPGVELKLDLNYDRVNFSRDNISVAIRNSTIEPPADALIREMGTEWIGPVCSPGYALANRITTPADLAGKRLLASQTRPNAWAEFLASAQIEGAAMQNFDHFYLVVQAAACGLGVAMVPQMLVLDDLRANRLIAPFGFTPGPRRLSLWIAPQAAHRHDVRALEQWLMAQMQASTGGR